MSGRWRKKKRKTHTVGKEGAAGLEVYKTWKIIPDCPPQMVPLPAHTPAHARSPIHLPTNLPHSLRPNTFQRRSFFHTCLSLHPPYLTSHTPATFCLSKHLSRPRQLPHTCSCRTTKITMFSLHHTSNVFTFSNLHLHLPPPHFILLSTIPHSLSSIFRLLSTIPYLFPSSRFTSLSTTYQPSSPHFHTNTLTPGSDLLHSFLCQIEAALPQYHKSLGKTHIHTHAQKIWF